MTSKAPRPTERTRRRFARRQWARRWLSLRYVIALLLVIVLLATGIWLFFFSAVLQVKKVDVSGVEQLSKQSVRRIADVPLGDQLALVDLERVSRRVGSMAEVKAVDVTRAWPDSVQIAVTERTAVAVVELAGRIRGLDADGVVFRDYRKVPPGMPRVRPAASAGSDALKEAATIVAALPADLVKRVDHVEVETVDQVTLVLRDGRRVMWGSAEDSVQKAEVAVVLLGEQGRIFDVSVPGSPTSR